jgi:hypothetical protein
LDRQIIYPGQIPLDTDQLLQSRNTFVGIGHVNDMLYGPGTTSVGGFSCTPGLGLSVVVAPGSVLGSGSIDDTAYGSLPAVTSQITRQYIMRDPTTLAVPGAGATYYIYALAARADTGAAVLPFYNASNPAQALAGPGNSGQAQPSVRQDVATVGIGASVPTGGIALWTVTVPAGATSITQAMIARVASSPFMPTIPQLNPGRYLGFARFTVSGTYTPSANANRIRVKMVGAGGGGGGGASNGTNGSSAGVGGAAGAYMEFEVALNQITAPVAISIGVGQAVFATGGLNGTAGTGTTFGTYANCSGGGGGAGGATSAPGVSGQVGASAGGVPSSNTVVQTYSTNGQSGAPALTIMNGSGNQPLNTPSLGASSIVGTGGGNNNAGSGGNASGFGAGGGGGGSTTGTAYPGGNGSGGWMLIEEYT